MKEKTLLQILQKLKLMRDYYEQVYANKSENLHEIDKLLERPKLQKLTQEEIV